MSSLAELVDMAVPLHSRIFGEASQLWEVPLDEEPEDELEGDLAARRNVTEVGTGSNVQEDPDPPVVGVIAKASGYGVLGLSPAQRINVRKRILRACWLGYKHRDSIHYSMDQNQRWAIAEKRWSVDGLYPFYSDCSAYSSYLMRDATRMYNLHDFVNGYSWLFGYTGTMVKHGSPIVKPTLIGDQIFVRGTASVPAHVQTYIGNGRAFSHGQERGPLIVAWNNSTVVGCRRYIR